MKKALRSLRSDASGKPAEGAAPKRWLAMNGRTAMVVWVVAAAFWTWHHWESDSGTRQVEEDVEAMITDAREAVDFHVRLYKVLPDRVPAPVIGDLVTLKAIDASANPPVYALEAKIGEVTRQWQGPSTEAGR